MTDVAGENGNGSPAGPRPRVLVVDDEPMVREVVQRYLAEAGFAASTAANGREALDRIAEDPPDLVVLDVMLPEVDGITVLGEIRRQGDLPVILLTARSDEIDRVVGLEFGADDYVVKPFSPRELVARVRTVLRRAAPNAEAPAAATLEFDGLQIDTRSREVLVDGSEVQLTRKEFELLLHLASAPRQVFSRAQLLEAVWESKPEWQDPSTVTVHVRRLRSKVERDPDNPRWITTAWGVGYRFDP